MPVIISGFDSSATISVTLTVKFGRLLFSAFADVDDAESITEAGEVITLPGTQDEVNKALAGLWYAAPLNWNSPGQGSFEILSIVIDDKNTAQNNDPYPAVPRTLVIHVAPVNDRPSLQGPSEIRVLEGYKTITRGIVVADPDARETKGGVIEATVIATEPGSILTLGSELGLYVTQSTDENKTFQGSLESVTHALAGLTYQSPIEFSGRIELRVVVDDMGNTGEGGPLSASLTIPVNVRSVNNPPRVMLEGGVILKGMEDEDIKVGGVLVEDQDAGSGQVRLTLEALYGAIYFKGDLSDLDIDQKDGAEDGRVAVFGTIKVKWCNTLYIRPRHV